MHKQKLQLMFLFQNMFLSKAALSFFYFLSNTCTCRWHFLLEIWSIYLLFTLSLLCLFFLSSLGAFEFWSRALPLTALVRVITDAFVLHTVKTTRYSFQNGSVSQVLGVSGHLKAGVVVPLDVTKPCLPHAHVTAWRVHAHQPQYL